MLQKGDDIVVSICHERRRAWVSTRTDARRADIQGSVELRVVVENGEVKTLERVSGDRILFEASRQNVAGWIFEQTYTGPFIGSSGWSDYAAERLWSEPVERDIVALRNVPFLAYGFSFDDWVRVEEVDGDLVVREVVRSRGHSTYRIFLDNVRPDSAVFAGQRSALEEIGCILSELLPVFLRLIFHPIRISIGPTRCSKPGRRQVYGISRKVQ